MSVKQGVTLDFMSAETFLPVQDLVLNKLIALKSRHVSVRGLLQPSRWWLISRSRSWLRFFFSWGTDRPQERLLHQTEHDYYECQQVDGDEDGDQCGEETVAVLFILSDGFSENMRIDI